MRLNRTPNTGLEDIKLVAFDLDDTLAPSKSALDPTMARLLVRLAELVPVCIISGGSFEQFRSQVLAGIEELREPTDTSGNWPISRFHLMPTTTCGTQILRVDGRSVVAHLFRGPRPRRQGTNRAGLDGRGESLGLGESQTWGPILEDRGSQITFSALGQAAPVENKTAWDPRGDKKEKLRAHAAERLPGLEVRSGGSTSLDVTAKESTKRTA